MWTLRDQKYCKNDFWVEVLQYLIKNKNFSDQISKENFIGAKKEIIDNKTFWITSEDEGIGSPYMYKIEIE